MCAKIKKKPAVSFQFEKNSDGKFDLKIIGKHIPETLKTKLLRDFGAGAENIKVVRSDGTA